ncbi:ABC transporter permease [Neobacillus sp. SM06]|uniref:ABC transporter permease n=1 Tax=Neobacillus sp. SM06 TaxID=3422492 RepID=UPI003D2DE6DD
MRQIIKDIFINKKIFLMLFIGFLLTISPILIAFSTKNYYDELFYDSKNGFFQYYYSINLSNVKELDFHKMQELAESNFIKSSVITETISAKIPEIGFVMVVGLLNKNIWSPPLIKGAKLDLNETNNIIAGKNISSTVGKIKLFDKEYTIKGITGKGMGSEYNSKIYLSLKNAPEQIKRDIEKSNTLQLIVRSNQSPNKEINGFVSKVKQMNKIPNIKIINEKANYENQKNSRQGVKEVLSYPYKLFIIALINCITVSYLWIYLKRKDISLRKALGASNLNLFSFVFGQLLICATLATVSSIVILWVLGKIGNNILYFTSYNIGLSFYLYLTSLVITFVVSFITSIIPFLHIMKIEPAKALKE